MLQNLENGTTIKQRRRKPQRCLQTTVTLQWGNDLLYRNHLKQWRLYLLSRVHVRGRRAPHGPSRARSARPGAADGDAGHVVACRGGGVAVHGRRGHPVEEEEGGSGKNLLAGL